MEDTTKWPRMVRQPGRVSLYSPPRPPSTDGLYSCPSSPQIQEFIHRGWTDAEIGGLMGGNLLRAMDEVAAVQRALANETESAAIYEKRTDLPAHDWSVSRRIPSCAWLEDWRAKGRPLCTQR